jgi:hypothetical protein
MRCRGGVIANTIRITLRPCIDKNDCEPIVKTLDECFSIVERGLRRSHTSIETAANPARLLAVCSC